MGLSIQQLNRVQYLRSSMAVDAFLGNYKSFKEAKKEYATLAIQDFKAVKKLPAPSINFPLFTKYGFNMLYVMGRDFFRKKTPAEKQLKQIGLEELKQQYAQTGGVFDKHV